MWVFSFFHKSKENFLSVKLRAVTCFLSSSRSQLQQGNSGNVFNKLSVLYMQVCLQVRQTRLLKHGQLSLTRVLGVVVVHTLIASIEELCIVCDVQKLAEHLKLPSAQSQVNAVNDLMQLNGFVHERQQIAHILAVRGNCMQQPQSDFSGIFCSE